MDNKQALDVGVGDEEAVRLSAKPVEITSIDITQHTFADKPTDQLVVMAKHPDKQEPLQIFQIAYQKGSAIKSVGMSLYYDSKGKILKGTAVAELLKVTNSSTPRELIGKQVPTIATQKGFLAFKAY